MAHVAATIIPIAAGKGGVGKSFLAANLAIALGAMGHRTIAVDLDLGGSNLNAFLGIANRYAGIGDFLQAKSAALEELPLATGFDNLAFIPGDGKSPFMGNIAYVQKRKLMAALRRLPAEYLVLDLSAGSAFNTLDFFGLDDNGMLVVTPDTPAIINMLVFVKNYLLRRIKQHFAGDPTLSRLLRDAFKSPLARQARTIAALGAHLAAETPASRAQINDLCARIRPRVVFNMAEQPEDLNLAHQIDKSLREVLGLQADFFGFVFFDQAVRNAVRRNVAFWPHNRHTAAGEAIERIAQRVVRFWDRPVRDSIALLARHIVAGGPPGAEKRF